MSRDTTFTTFSGRRVDILHPRPEDIDLRDMVAGVARAQRFAGQFQTRECYSVAEHQVLVSHLVPFKLAKHGLVHDGVEAWLQDMISPLKHSGGMGKYRHLEHVWELLLWAKLDLKPPTEKEHTSIKRGDRVAFATERRDLYSPPRPPPKGVRPAQVRIRGLAPIAAANLYRARFKELFGHDPCPGGIVVVKSPAVLAAMDLAAAVESDLFKRNPRLARASQALGKDFNKWFRKTK